MTHSNTVQSTVRCRCTGCPGGARMHQVISMSCACFVEEGHGQGTGKQATSSKGQVGSDRHQSAPKFSPFSLCLDTVSCIVWYQFSSHPPTHPPRHQPDLKPQTNTKPTLRLLHRRGGNGTPGVVGASGCTKPPQWVCISMTLSRREAGKGRGSRQGAAWPRW